MSFIYAYNPDKIEKKDLETLKKFEKLYYYTVTKNEAKENDAIFNKLLNCVKKNKNILNKLRIYSTITAEKSIITGDKDIKGAITLEYNILDKKEDRQLEKETIDKENKAIELASSYLKTKQTIAQLKRRIKLLELKEVRLKAREKTGIINTDERLKNLDTLLKTKEQLENSLLNLEVIKNKIKVFCR